ncbi:MAG: hypothetical protein HN961_09890 [Planctomycetes bacterium]|jgi:hypothetical protein|nr:hypothetical protein [Planctomycetota bacterium]MBT5102194.1 hypothetical protein [Planctomycetota bacterium]MBT7013206.1 hypothetical protein [Planctomycetota bacterium]
MNPSHTALEGILSLCDSLRRSLDAQLRDPGPQSETLAETTRLQAQQQGPDLLALIPGLPHQPEAARLPHEDLLLLALLFHRTIDGGADALAGAELVALLGIAGFDRGASLGMLNPGSRLRTGPWLLAENPQHAFDPIDTQFRLSHSSLALFWPGYAGEAGKAGSKSTSSAAADHPEPIEPYRSEEQLLWDLYTWRNLSLQRAEALFEQGKRKLSQSPRFRDLRREARGMHLRIRARIGRTAKGRDFGIEKFTRDHKLDADELLIVVHLLFCELAEMEPYVPAPECLRLVADSRNDLFRKRRLFTPKSRLRKTGIMQAEGEEYSKLLAAHFSLADWAEDRILAGVIELPRFDEKDLDDFFRGEG